MTELELRLSILHPETRYLEVVIDFRRIYAQHEALPNLATVCRRPLKCRRNDSTPSLRTIRLNPVQEKNKRCAAKHSPLFLRRLPISSMGGCYSRVEVEKWRLRQRIDWLTQSSQSFERKVREPTSDKKAHHTVGFIKEF